VPGSEATERTGQDEENEAKGMSAPVLNFDAATHRYTVDGVDYPSVTTVIEAAGLVDYDMLSADDLEFYRQRGTALHQACWFDDEGDLNEATVDPLVMSRLSAWRKFRSELPFNVVTSERRLFDRRYGFAGTPDRHVEFPDGKRGVIEIKSGAIQSAAAIQTAAQSYLLEANGEYFDLKRYAVHLKPNGGYSVKEFFVSAYRQDLSVFLSALTCFKWREANT
jgi:hypothetical protein